LIFNASREIKKIIILYKLALFKEKIHENGLTQDALAAIAAIF
jgi:hypothetical protein